MKQPHQHIADTYHGKSGSAFDCDRTYRSKRFPPGAAVAICLLLSPFAWAAIIMGVMAVWP